MKKNEKEVKEVKQSEEWEAVRMSILSIGMELGRENILREKTARKLEKGKSVSVIAEELEEEPEVIEKIAKELKASE